MNGSIECQENREYTMDVREIVAPIPVSGESPAARAVARDGNFDARWAAWLERGHTHEQHVRRRFVIWASVLSMGAAIVYAFLRS